jgi:hypothetical protein
MGDWGLGIGEMRGMRGIRRIIQTHIVLSPCFFQHSISIIFGYDKNAEDLFLCV